VPPYPLWRTSADACLHYAQLAIARLVSARPSRGYLFARAANRATGCKVPLSPLRSTLKASRTVWRGRSSAAVRSYFCYAKSLQQKKSYKRAEELCNEAIVLDAKYAGRPSPDAEFSQSTLDHNRRAIMPAAASASACRLTLVCAAVTGLLQLKSQVVHAPRPHPPAPSRVTTQRDLRNVTRRRRRSVAIQL
jgi:hypothetical protein